MPGLALPATLLQVSYFTVLKKNLICCSPPLSELPSLSLTRSGALEIRHFSGRSAQVFKTLLLLFSLPFRQAFCFPPLPPPPPPPSTVQHMTLAVCCCSRHVVSFRSYDSCTSLPPSPPRKRTPTMEARRTRDGRTDGRSTDSKLVFFFLPPRASKSLGVFFDYTTVLEEITPYTCSCST